MRSINTSNGVPTGKRVVSSPFVWAHRILALTGVTSAAIAAVFSLQMSSKMDARLNEFGASENMTSDAVRALTAYEQEDLDRLIEITQTMTAQDVQILLAASEGIDITTDIEAQTEVLEILGGHGWEKLKKELQSLVEKDANGGIQMKAAIDIKLGHYIEKNGASIIEKLADKKAAHLYLGLDLLDDHASDTDQGYRRFQRFHIDLQLTDNSIIATVTRYTSSSIGEYKNWEVSEAQNNLVFILN